MGSYPAPDLSADGYFAFEFAYIPPREWPGVRLSVTFLVTLACIASVSMGGGVGERRRVPAMRRYGRFILVCKRSD